jgi:transcriptional regulator with XRE-family HTH domain
MPSGRPSPEPRTPFGQRLLAAREAAGRSQAEVAAKLGLKQAAYAAWERYPVALRPDQIEAVARLLKIPVRELFEKPSRRLRRNGPVGRARRAFEEVSQLSRAEQKNILEMVEVLVRAVHRRQAARAARASPRGAANSASG